MPTANPYDALPYDALPVRASHPERLIVTSALNGGPRPSLAGRRLLEAGCADGANLLPLAFYHPELEVIGIDSSARQIEAAIAARERVGLPNLQIEQRDLTHGAEDLDELDFIVAHGFYSWVPVPVRQRFLELCRDQLSADGLVYVSFNTFPGWRVRGLIRDLLLRTVGEIPDPKTRGQQAQALAHTLRGLLEPSGGHPYSELLDLELGLVVESGISNVLHDHMEADQNPVGFGDFLREIEGYGLHYLGELPPGPREGARLDQTRRALRAQGLAGLELEQTVDLLAYRQLRTSVLCRREAGGQTDPSGALDGVFVSGELMAISEEPSLEDGAAEVFETSEGLELAFTEPLLKALLLAIDDAHPSALSLPELGAQVSALLGRGADGDADATAVLRQQLPDLYALGLVDLRLSPGPKPGTPSLHAHALARLEAERGSTLTSCAHVLLPLDDFDQQVIPRLDGETSREALLTSLVETLAGGDQAIEIDGEVVSDPAQLRPMVEDLLTSCLETLGEWGMLVPTEAAP